MAINKPRLLHLKYATNCAAKKTPKTIKAARVLKLVTMPFTTSASFLNLPVMAPYTIPKLPAAKNRRAIKPLIKGECKMELSSLRKNPWSRNKRGSQQNEPSYGYINGNTKCFFLAKCERIDRFGSYIARIGSQAWLHYFVGDPGSQKRQLKKVEAAIK